MINRVQGVASSEHCVGTLSNGTQLLSMLIPYAVCSALRTEHVRSLRIGISLKMSKYPVKSTLPSN